MYPDQGRISGLTFGDLMDEAVESAGKWSDEFDNKNTLNDWAAYITIYLARALEYGVRGDKWWQYKALIKVANLALLAATRVRGDTQFGKIAPRHYDA